MSGSATLVGVSVDGDIIALSDFIGLSSFFATKVPILIAAVSSDGEKRADILGCL